MLAREHIVHNLLGQGRHGRPLVAALEGDVSQAEDHGWDDMLQINQ